MSESKRCILVVDSEALVRWSLGQRLGERGYRVLQAATAGTALQLADQADLVLMEPQLPDGDGRDLARRLRRSRPQRGLVLMTAWSGPDLERLVRDGVVDAVIEKPFGLDEVQSLARRYIDGS
jgi:DNA-binding response OmpR family regulator